MSAQTVAPRSRRRNQAEPDDVVLARALEFTHWARANIRLVVIGAVLAVALVGGLLFWRANNAARAERAAMDFMALEQTVNSGNTALATRELQQYIARFDGTEQAEEARIILARTYLEAGQPAEAAEAVQRLAGRPGASTLATQAAFLHAAALQQSGSMEEAIAAFTRIGESKALDFQRADAYASAARLRSEAGQFGEAAELYARAAGVAREGSAERTIYEMRRAEAEARARAAS